MSPRVRGGLEILLEERRELLAGARVALLSNHTAVDAQLRHAALLLGDGPGDLRLLLSPEHGPWGTHQDMEAVPGGADPIFGRPVVSLYGDDEASLQPDLGLFDDIDVVVFDVQDVGARYYTYVYSLLHAMESAGPRGVRFVVCDRPNPIGGERVEGNLVRDDYRSFVGRRPLANRHGLTVGELARLFNTEGLCELDVVSMRGWRRSQRYDDTGLPWVAPSPNMPRLETALLYPGLCLLEGTNLSEGRGTTLPFELFGAPWLPARAFADALNDAALPGLAFRPMRFRPMFQKHAGVLCGGAQAHVRDAALVEPVLAGLTIIDVARRLAPEDFSWRTERYEFVSDRLAIDLLAGGPAWRLGLEAGESPRSLLARDEEQRTRFLATRREVLLYD